MYCVVLLSVVLCGVVLGSVVLAPLLYFTQKSVQKYKKKCIYASKYSQKFAYIEKMHYFCQQKGLWLCNIAW